jgi:carboxyl-terminal processing protease
MLTFNRFLPKIRQIFLIASFATLVSCGGGSGGSSSCSVNTENTQVHEAMLARYYWYQEIPQTINFNDFDSAAETLDFLRFDEFDHFSYITEQASFDNLFGNGQFVGYGFGFVTEDDGQVFTRFVYDNSPAGRGGLLRGDEILKINDEPVADIIAASAWGEVFGPAEIGIPLELEIRRASGEIEVLNLNKDVVSINTVLFSDIIEQDSIKIGYLVFNSFLSTSLAELETVFQQFSQASVDRLVLDLRYNGGGRVDVGRELASYIADTDASRYVQLRHNDKNQTRDFTYFFKNQTHGLNLDEVTVITSGSTCSASEQVISGLSPFIDVKTVGTTTCGKPVGMNPENFCGLSLLAVNFASFNANDDGEYFDGIAASCVVDESDFLPFGDEQEPLLKTALDFTTDATCPVQKKARSKSKPIVDAGLGRFTGAW